MMSRACLLLPARGAGLLPPAAARGLAAAAAGGPGSDADQPGHPLDLTHPTYAVWGANTDVGKTLVSAGLAAVSSAAKVDMFYLKPAQTGFPEDCDARLVAAAGSGKATYGEHAAEAAEVRTETLQVGRGVTARTLFGWRAAVSPHLAVEMEGRAVPDAALVAAARAELAAFAAAVPASGSSIALLETAGGVLSPGPSGRLQADLLRPLRLPGLLVGDGRLGGISATLSSYESLLLRGYDVDVVAMLDGGYRNHEALGAHMSGGPVHAPPTHVLLPAPPARPSSPAPPGALDEEAARWLERAEPALLEILDVLRWKHARRVEELAGQAEEAAETLWWPFTQHTMTPTGEVTVIDGRCGEDFSVFKKAEGAAAAGSGALHQQFDACASWWTQGVDATLQPEMARALAYSAGRYGHVILPESAHAPAVGAARRLLDGPGRGWAARVFYSDDGSTANEVAIKMGFRKYITDHGLSTPLTAPLRLLALKNSYHGDTLGCMDASEPSVFNGDLQTPWYSGRGVFLDPPTAAMVKGTWQVALPGDLAAAAAAAGVGQGDLEVGSRDYLFDQTRDHSPLAEVYRSAIETAIDEGSAEEEGAVASLLMEPVLQGAGGMLLLDPLYQRELVAACRRRNIPVILDEVFSGLWRLGAVSGADLLGVHPDVACYAKLLTAGTVPLAATMASEDIFDAFLGDSKIQALLHGHSYAGNPIGCGAACRALDLYTDPSRNPNYIPASKAQTILEAVTGGGGGREGVTPPPGSMVELWDEGLAARMSEHPRVARVVNIGTVLIAELEPGEGGGGYASTGARGVVMAMRGGDGGVYARPLGNVVYLMVTPTTSLAACRRLQERLLAQLDAAE